MTALIGGSISLNGIFNEHDELPFNLASGIVVADVGKAVTLDTGAANTMKLCGAGDVIYGRLEVVENRGASGTKMQNSAEGNLIGTVSISGGLEFPYDSDSADSATVPAIGDSIMGAVVGTNAHPIFGTGSGFVAKLAVSQDTPAGGGSTDILRAKHSRGWIVVEVNTTRKTVVAVKF